MTHQETYLARLQSLHASKHELAQKMMSLLNISKDAVYRRLRGDTSLSAEELLQLQKHYQLGYGEAANTSLFRFNFAERKIRSPTEYIDQLSERMERVQGLTGVNLLLAHPGIPFFHEMVYPRLLAFKLFIYGGTCWNFPGWQEAPFRPDFVDNKALDRAFEIGAYSYTIPGRELWTMGILNATIDQIEFMHLAGRFADESDAFGLLDDLGEMVDHLEAMARAGRKFVPGADAEEGGLFHPAHNELANNDNSILIQSDQAQLLFAIYLTPNFLQTSNPIVCEMSRTWFDLVDELSSPLGAAGGRHRGWFFNRLRKQLTSARERLHSESSIEF